MPGLGVCVKGRCVFLMLLGDCVQAKCVRQARGGDVCMQEECVCLYRGNGCVFLWGKCVHSFVLILHKCVCLLGNCVSQMCLRTGEMCRTLQLCMGQMCVLDYCRSEHWQRKINVCVSACERAHFSCVHTGKICVSVQGSCVCVCIRGTSVNIGTSVNAVQTMGGGGGGGTPTSVNPIGECVYSGGVYASALYRKPLCWCCKGEGMYV